MRFYTNIPIHKVRIWRRRLQMAVKVPALLAAGLCGLSAFVTLWFVLGGF